MIEITADEMLDHGAYKTCYVKKGKAYLIKMDPGRSIRYDYKRHLKLKAMGFDVADCKLTTVKFNGRKRLAMECELFGDNFIGDWIDGTKLKSRPTKMLKRALRDLRKIFDTIEAKKTVIVDLQFLVCYRTGRVVVSDPNGFKKVRNDHDRINWLENLKDVLEATSWLSDLIKRRNS